MIPDFMLPGALFSWEAIMAWFVVGWTGLMTYSCMGAFWWRWMIPYHVERCRWCRINHDGHLYSSEDHEIPLFAGALLWPLASVLYFLQLIIWKPIAAAVRGIITPAPPAPEPEPELPKVPTGVKVAVQGHFVPEVYDPHEVVEKGNWLIPQ